MVLLAVVVSAVYLMGVGRRAGWPLSLTVLFLGGVALYVVITCSVLGMYAHTLFWALSVQDVLLLVLVSLPLMLGRPLELLVTRGPRVHLPPALGALGGLVALLALYVTDLDQLRLEHLGLLSACQVALVVIGCGFTGPLLGERDGSYGSRTVVAFVDGLLDAVPGLAVLGSHGTIPATYYADTRGRGPGMPATGKSAAQRWSRSRRWSGSRQSWSCSSCGCARTPVRLPRPTSSWTCSRRSSSKSPSSTDPGGRSTQVRSTTAPSAKVGTELARHPEKSRSGEVPIG